MDDTKSTDDEFEEKELVFTRLRDLVREQYTNFLRKQLETNVRTWLHTNGRKRKFNEIAQPRQFDEYIKAGVAIMEDEAIRACMATQVYQRNMLKCIASVRRHTEQACLERHLEELLNSETEPPTKKFKYSDFQAENFRGDERTSMSLQQKIEFFQCHFAAAQPTNGLKQEPIFDNPTATSTPLNAELPAAATPPPSGSIRVAVDDDDDENDPIAQQLEEMFREEKTEFDVIYEGSQRNGPDDPRMQSILDEIKMAQLNNKDNKAASESPRSLYHSPESDGSHSNQKRSYNLRHSPWPCKLHMQRRRLSQCLMNLLEEDLRWQEIIAWKFQQLFGDDSDDEFTSDSPRMEMDEVVMSSCMHRISHWLVTHLMKPLNDGLIGNRYLFKLLAKKLGRHIILQNCYPNEEYIKRSVATFFCSRPAVMSVHDLADIIDL